ncbi:MAG: dicarboxylate/amino acid:cation symporter [Lentimicrobiaceae bacterium]|nr:dicarboxylate/amino acid:cation symporter [Lentimicrobiaceae bacterium]
MKILKLKLHWQILIGLALGVLCGAFLKEYVRYIAWIGDLFLRGMLMIVIPLILSSLISGVTNIGTAERLGRIAMKTFAFYMFTTLLAIVTGLFLVNLIKPGVGADLGFSQKIEALESVERSFGDTLIHIVPTSIFKAFAENEMLATIFVAILMGYFIMKLSPSHKAILTDFFNATFDLMMKITMFVIRFAPLGIFAIVARIVSEQSDLGELFSRLGLYMIVVISGLAIHSIVFLPLIILLIGRVNPLKHYRSISTPLLTAFTTASSNATLPLSMEAVEHNCGVSNRITSFTLPLGATINMNGTAAYECVAAMFIAQAYGIPLTVVQQVVVVFTALLAAIGSAGVPMAGLVMMTIVLSAVGLPLEGIGLILAVDRILDMFRTTVNVLGDTCGAVVVARSEGEALPNIQYTNIRSRRRS